MTRSHWMSIVAAMCLGTSTAAFADPITIVNVQRRVSVSPPLSIQTDGDVLFVTTSPAGTSPASGTASLTSSIVDPMHWSGTGSTTATWGSSANVSATAEFFAEFFVTSPLTYAFDVRLGSTSRGLFDNSSSNVALLTVFTGRFDRDNEEVFESLVGLGTPGPAVDTGGIAREFGGLLAPGKYQLLLDARSGPAGFALASGTAATDFSFALDFTSAAAAPTPEPASMLLLGTGLAGLLGFHRRAKTRTR